MSNLDPSMIEFIRNQAADNTIKHGPAYRALNARYRAYVLTCVLYPNLRHAQAAICAGYEGSQDVLTTTGYRLSCDERVKAAILEETHNRLTSFLPVATTALAHFLDKPEKHEDKYVLQAIAMIFDRVGLPAMTTQNINVKHEVTDTEAVSKIADACTRLGLDPKVLLGAAAKALPAPDPLPAGSVSMETVVEADFVEVTATEEEITDDGLGDILG